MDPIQPGVLRGGVPLRLSGAGSINRDVYSSHNIDIIRALLYIIYHLNISFQNQTKFSNLDHGDGILFVQFLTWTITLEDLWLAVGPLLSPSSFSLQKIAFKINVPYVIKHLIIW